MNPSAPFIARPVATTLLTIGVALAGFFAFLRLPVAPLLKSDPALDNGFYRHQSDVHVGLRRHAQIWSVMGLCQDFYNKEAWREVGFTSLEDFLHRFWEAYFAPIVR